MPVVDEVVQAEIEMLRSLRVMVDSPSSNSVILMGDVILDRYFHGWANHLNAFAPAPVVKVIRTNESAGAAAHIARALVNLGLKVRFFAILGGDENGHIVAQQLYEEGVDTSDIRVAAHLSTVAKTRIYGSRESLIDRHQLLLQFDEESQEELPESIVERLADSAIAALPGAGAVVLSDYGKGVISDAGASRVIAAAKAAEVPVICDPKLTGLHRTVGATVALFEIRGLELLRRRNNLSTAEETAAHFIAENDWQAMLVLGGEHGVTLYQRDEPPLKLPCLVDAPKQLIGLHDAAATALAAALSNGRSLAEGARLANAACECILAAEASFEVLDRKTLSTRLDELAWQLQISER
jgi:D-beta-D-heptose 7-phosphate kinase/D-beta-D-heptose 1-phosphate adenosyltransferase